MNTPISYELFEKSIKGLIETFNKNDAFSKAMEKVSDTYFISELHHPASSIALGLLEAIFKDEGEWISYWMFELDYGLKADDLTAHEADGTPISLKTIQDLYNLLIKNLNEN